MATLSDYKNSLYAPPSAKIDRVDPRLVEIARIAAESFPYPVAVTPHGGYNARASGTKNHPGGFAMDFVIRDPKTGRDLGNYRDPNSFRVYEQFAQAMRAVQQDKYPELNDVFRFGGYFGGRAAYDQMHVDINPAFRGAMSQGSWKYGLGRDAAGRTIGIAPYMRKADSVGLGAAPPPALAARSPVPAGVAAPWTDRQMMPPAALGYMGPDVGPLTGAPGATAAMTSGLPPDAAAPSGPTPLEGARNIGLWDRGDDVRAVQEQLAALGFNPGNIDGVYGPNTARAVAAYQATNGGLKPDAIAGPVTQGALRSDLLGPTAGIGDVRAMMGTPDYMPAGPMGNPWGTPSGPPPPPSWPSDAGLRTSSGRDAALDYLESLRPGGGSPTGPSWPGDAALRTPDGRDAAVGYLESLRPGYAGPSPGAGFGWAGPSVAPGSDMFSRYSALPDMTEQVPTPRERPSMFDRALSGPGMDMTGMGDRPSWSAPVVSAFGSGAVRPSAGVTVTEDPMKDDRGAMFSPTAALGGGPGGGSSVGAGASADGPPMYSYDPWSGGYSNYGG